MHNKWKECPVTSHRHFKKKKYFKNSQIQHTICVHNWFHPLALSARTAPENYTSLIQTPGLSPPRWPCSIRPRSAIPSDYHWQEVRTCWERHFPLLILDLTLGQTTNNSFPRGVQRSIIHTDLSWLQFSFIFSRRWGGEKRNHTLL